MNKSLIDLKNLAIMITDKCNLDCYHCFREEYKHNKEFDIKLTTKLVDFIKTTTVDYLRITGGEPFIYKNLSSVIEAFSNINIRTSIVSNGSLCTNSSLKALNEAGLSEIWFSVHSSKESTHELLTGNNSTFQNLVKSIRNSLELNIQTNIYLPVSYENIQEVNDTLLWLEALKVNRVKIIRMTPLGKATPDRFNHVTERDWMLFINKIRDLNFSFQSLKIQGNENLDRIPKCTILPFRHINIDTDGGIYPCCLISGNQEYKIGNISEISTKNYLNELSENARDLMIKHGSFPCLKCSNKKGCPLFSEEVDLITDKKLAVTKAIINAECSE